MNRHPIFEVMGVHHGVPHALHRRVDLDLGVDGAHAVADTNDQGRLATRSGSAPMLAGEPSGGGCRCPLRGLPKPPEFASAFESSRFLQVFRWM
jgi:hypothetical protein